MILLNLWIDLRMGLLTMANRFNPIFNNVKLRLINNISPKIYKPIELNLIFTIQEKKVIL